MPTLLQSYETFLVKKWVRNLTTGVKHSSLFVYRLSDGQIEDEYPCPLSWQSCVNFFGEKWLGQENSSHRENTLAYFTVDSVTKRKKVVYPCLLSWQSCKTFFAKNIQIRLGKFMPSGKHSSLFYCRLCDKEKKVSYLCPL